MPETPACLQGASAKAASGNESVQRYAERLFSPSLQRQWETWIEVFISSKHRPDNGNRDRDLRTGTRKGTRAPRRRFSHMRQSTRTLRIVSSRIWANGIGRGLHPRIPRLHEVWRLGRDGRLSLRRRPDHRHDQAVAALALAFGSPKHRSFDLHDEAAARSNRWQDDRHHARLAKALTGFTLTFQNRAMTAG